MMLHPLANSAPGNGGIVDAMERSMNLRLLAQVRHTLSQEVFRRGLLSWDMKLALRALVGQ